MADESTGADEHSKDAQGTEGDTGAEDTSKDGAAEDSSGADDSAEGQNDTSSQDADDEPQVRKSSKDYIIERKDKKIAKLQGGKGETDADESQQPDIRTIIKEELAPITATFAKSKALAWC